MRVDGLVLKRSGLDRVVFARNGDSVGLKARGHGMMRDLQLHRVVLKNCSFVDCVFDVTRFEGFEASDLQFDGVDFSGVTITSAADLARLAGDRRVA